MVAAVAAVTSAVPLAEALVHQRLVALGQVQRYLDMFEYGYDKAFQQLGCSTRVKFKP